MGNPIKQVITGTGTSAPIAMNWRANPFNATVQVVLTGGTTSFGLEYTLDDLAATPPASVRWVGETTGNLPSGSTAGGTVRYTAPVCGLRLNVASLSGGNLEMRVLQ